MHCGHPIAAVTLALLMVGLPIGNARAFDETKYPSWKGQWVRTDSGAPR